MPEEAGCALTGGVAEACNCVLAAAVAGALAALVAVLVKLLAVDGEAVAPAAEVEAEGWEVALLAAVTAFVSPLPNCAMEPD